MMADISVVTEHQSISAHLLPCPRQLQPRAIQGRDRGLNLARGWLQVAWLSKFRITHFGPAVEVVSIHPAPAPTHNPPGHQQQQPAATSSTTTGHHHHTSYNHNHSHSPTPIRTTSTHTHKHTSSSSSTSTTQASKRTSATTASILGLSPSPI